MKKLMIVAASAALLAGCGVSEAEKFGYRGADLDEGDMMFFSTGPTVTNWVPARVLSVCEEYEISPEEAALVKAAGVIEPSSSFETAPEGYAKLHDEPWFVTWQKDAENFGIKGVNGFISHYNEEKKIWETSETYFSSYYDDEAGALAALADLKKKIGEGFAPKKFHEFDRCWVAEYLRLRVMCLVGQKADGKWSCMLDINDKCRPGCGQWEPVPAQEERLADYKYRKDLAAWKAARAKAIAANHEAIEKLRAEKGIELFGAGVAPFDAGDGRKVYQRIGSIPVEEVKDREAFWQEKLAALAKSAGVTFEGEVAKEQVPSGHEVRGLAASSDIYDVRLDMAFPPPPADKSDGEAAAETPEGEQMEPPPQIIEWRELCIEKMLPSFAVPPRPQPPKR